MRYIIGDVLRQKRKEAGLEICDIKNYLEEKGINVAIKTIYGWELNISHPSVTAFLLLCELYKIDDVMGTFTENFIK